MSCNRKKKGKELWVSQPCFPPRLTSRLDLSSRLLLKHGQKNSKSQRRCKKKKGTFVYQTQVYRPNALSAQAPRSGAKERLIVTKHNPFSYPELRSSWPAPRIESSGKSQFCSPRFADFRSTAQPQGLENVEWSENGWLKEYWYISRSFEFWLAAFRCRPSSVEGKAVRSS